MSLRFHVPLGRAHRGRRAAIATTLLAVLLTAAPASHAQTPYNSLTLLWIAPGDDGNQGQVSGYEIRYGTTPPSGPDTTGYGTPVTLGMPLAAAGALDSTKINGLTQGTHYYFVMRAFDDAFNFSAFSNVAEATTLSCNPPTAAPPSFAAASDTGQVDVTWAAAADPLAQSLHLYRANGASGGTWNLIQNLPLGTLNYTDTNVTAGATYRYRAAYMGALCEGPYTATRTVTLPGTAPTQPPTSSDGASTIHAYPNPATSSLRVIVDVQAAAAMPVYLRLFDLTGHWIATIADGSYPPGATEVPWNRLGRDGRRVGPGYYEILGTVGISKVRERIVLLP